VGLILVGFIGGLLTGISPCIIPVLPVIFFAGGTQAARDYQDSRSVFGGRRPYLVILGLVLSFSFFTLAGSFLLSLLHLPQSTIIWIGVVALLLLGIGMIVPQFQHILEKPFSWIPQREATNDKGGLLLGITLGAVFVPCAGPVLAVIAIAGAKNSISANTLVETAAFAIGVAIPLLIFALAGRRLAERVSAFRRHQRGIRITAGVVMLVLAIAVVPVFNVPQFLLTLIPDYTQNLQAATQNVGGTVGFGKEKNNADSSGSAPASSSACTAESKGLVNCGPAPAFTGITAWFNTANNKPVTLKSLRGKVVLVDFWAYSCINCQRSTPHLNAWYKSYQKDGFVVVGLHAPEYAFEHVESNVMASAKQQGLKYPVGLDNNFDTWTAYGNQYWPAEYLIDAKGNVRHISFGEGEYSTTEKLIRSLLTTANPSVSLPKATDVPDTTPTKSLTPETYLGSDRAPASSFDSPSGYQQGTGTYTFPSGSLGLNDYAFKGQFTVAAQTITAANGPASIKLHYEASHVYLNVGGTGTLTVTDSQGTRTIPISGVPNIRDVLAPGGYRNSTVTITMSKGLTAYSFTFG
jgi:cytochrome c biogenesis protein CcdA/thiol-disulfide isomerase/thioredoxin